MTMFIIQDLMSQKQIYLFLKKSVLSHLSLKLPRRLHASLPLPILSAKFNFEAYSFLKTQKYSSEIFLKNYCNYVNVQSWE